MAKGGVLGIFLLITVAFATESSKESLSCDPTIESLVRYRVTFKAEWTSELFPKQYPKVRPNAQWSKMIGKFH